MVKEQKVNASQAGRLLFLVKAMLGDSVRNFLRAIKLQMRWDCV
jgi:hypothetical protein